MNIFKEFERKTRIEMLEKIKKEKINNAKTKPGC